VTPQTKRNPAIPVWIANDIYYSAGSLKVRCRGRCFVCDWRGPVRKAKVPDDLDVKLTRAGALARIDALRHADRKHRWTPATGSAS
jgi:hypothetical protein